MLQLENIKNRNIQRDDLRNMMNESFHSSRHSLIEELRENSHGVLIYGAGTEGTHAYKLLIEHGVHVTAFLDRKSKKNDSYLGVPMYQADDVAIDKNLKEHGIVLVAINAVNLDDINGTGLAMWLRELGYKNILSANVACNSPLIYDELDGKTEWADEVDCAMRVFEQMSDQESRVVFANVYAAHMSHNYALPCMNPNMTQYFDIHIPFKHNYRNFIDCGACNGDSLAEYSKRYQFERYYGFEPDKTNYESLSRFADTLPNRDIVLFPLGVSDENKFVRFDGVSGTGGTIIDKNADGKNVTTIQVVKIDDVIKNGTHSMIKMDIEGSEIAALNGARRLIENYSPDLAICVYHRVSDLWRIPEMLHEWMPNYKFYMRNHSWATLETVLYATT